LAAFVSGDAVAAAQVASGPSTRRSVRFFEIVARIFQSARRKFGESALQIAKDSDAA